PIERPLYLSVTPVCGPQDHPIVVVSSPIFSISILTFCPGLSDSPRSAPTPAGVPVKMRSPGYREIRLERCETCSAGCKIIWMLLESCLICPSTQSLIERSCGSEISGAGTIHGPRGHE